jgi:hypothetical protein
LIVLAPFKLWGKLESQIKLWLSITTNSKRLL